MAKLSKGALRSLDMLKDGEMTLAEMKAKGFENVNPSFLTALVNAKLVTATKVEVEVPTVVKRKVNLYALTDKGVDFDVNAVDADKPKDE